ncbi:MAG: 50S ribosomal protein L22 [Defluviitaleaceae bacterium]|nr:50S ribosomal protein L22 [Defluviitaleaceae bacterium]
MSKGHRSQIKRERNKTNRDTRPQAHAKYVRLSDTKARIVLEQIKGKDVKTATAILTYSPRYAAEVIGKVLKSAIANAENNLGMDVSKLYVQDVVANQGPTMKRVRPRAQGRAYKILKRTSHISVILNER